MKTKNVRELALDILLQIEKNQAYSNLLLNQKVNEANLNRKDIGLLTEIVYGTIQRKNTLDFYLEPFIKKQKKIETWVIVLLRLSCYQMVFLDRVPSHAVINEAVEIAKKQSHKGISGMVNGVLRNLQRNDLRNLDEVTNQEERLAIELSHPTWLIKRWLNQFGEEVTREMCQVNLKPPQVTVRVNQMKANVDEMLTILSEEGLEVERGDLSEDAIKVITGNVPNTKSFQDGFITIQDESSMLVSRALGPRPSEIVLDSCAAPGGKSTHIAEMMEGSGNVVSIDLHDHKVKLIGKAAERLKLENIETKAIDSRKLHEIYEKETFDRILIDAPCSGFGVIRRKPDIKWAKKEQDINNLASIQRKIIDAVAPLLKKGGTLVYSTCTLDKEENENIVEAFLNNSNEFTLDDTLMERMPEKLSDIVKNNKGMIQLLPHYFQTDGFFIACLKKK
ncbi:16S rRNA (cytosine(967)-C(5))-methyltransferase [Lottiidibacillus patelloidae]|uniref:16S rRNA (cytosine(967)-C(5))-methyltransferase n=1 Tax=Lottiidibacillus patelloidae TaxID=2670334 RepID=A0A263BZF7_9BACI|nr:16S rRNA (cytosine(967)-C(5))-methyltransferase RsmB [Lottiidibacillus patelloidae]OZM58546.1 16S rRNA (cytosine(967)-C(5))-methyltransferase [Lottiidibacillus patelloidae]